MSSKGMDVTARYVNDKKFEHDQMKRQTVALEKIVATMEKAFALWSKPTFIYAGPDDAPEILEPGAFGPLHAPALDRIADALETLIELITEEGEPDDGN